MTYSLANKCIHRYVWDLLSVQGRIGHALMALCGKVQIDHGGVQAAMAEILLNAADINSDAEHPGILLIKQIDRGRFSPSKPPF